ncbi:permease [Actinomycetospora rhizophila]|uniref:Permease n=1 Tax=Actinomycetospora rhizophila TaxID=1416876 RepID=A0ABV9Z7G3_9PSEU
MTTRHDPGSAPADADHGRAALLPAAGLLLAVCVAMLVGREIWAVAVGDDLRIATWATLFAAVVLQALPFLALGVLVAAMISAFVSPDLVRRTLGGRTWLAVPLATGAGAALPGCECGSVPVAARLMSRGVRPPAAVAFMLSSPAVNPVVVVATAVAFPGRPAMVLARVVASAALALVVGFLWTRVAGAPDLAPGPPDPPPDGEPSRGREVLLTARHALLQAGGFLVVGAAISATLTMAVPPEWTQALAGVPVLSVVVLGVLAVLLAVCSEADAFIASGLTAFSPTAQLAFMVVGPAVDVKLTSLHVGTFGPGFAARFAPLTFVVAIAAVLVVGGVLL